MISHYLWYVSVWPLQVYDKFFPFKTHFDMISKKCKIFFVTYLCCSANDIREAAVQLCKDLDNNTHMVNLNLRYVVKILFPCWIIAFEVYVNFSVTWFSNWISKRFSNLSWFVTFLRSNKISPENRQDITNWKTVSLRKDLQLDLRCVEFFGFGVTCL